MPLRSTAAASSGDSSSAGSGDRPPQLDRAARVAGKGDGHLGGDAPGAAGEEDHRLLPDAQRRHATGSVPGGRPCRRTISLVSRAPSRRPTSAGAPAAASSSATRRAPTVGSATSASPRSTRRTTRSGYSIPHGIHQGPDARALRHRVLERAGRGGLDAHASAEGGHEHDVGRALDQQPLEGREHVDHGRAGGVEEVGDHDDAAGQRRLAGARPPHRDPGGEQLGRQRLGHRVVARDGDRAGGRGPQGRAPAGPVTPIV